MPKKKTEPPKPSRGRPRKSRLTALAAFLTARREKANMTQADVAGAMGVLPSRVADLEAGRRDVVAAYLRQRGALERTAAAYGVTVEELIAAADTPR